MNIIYYAKARKCEDAFIKLKEALCKAPVHGYRYPDLPYVMNIDASNLAIGTEQ